MRVAPSSPSTGAAAQASSPSFAAASVRHASPPCQCHFCPHHCPCRAPIRSSSIIFPRESTYYFFLLRHGALAASCVLLAPHVMPSARKDFFIQWQDYQKLCFVGVHLIQPIDLLLTWTDPRRTHRQWPQPQIKIPAHITKVTVIISGVAIRYYKLRRLKKLRAVQEAERAERGEMEETVRTSDDVPFGVRAIEQGCEVEGVWNSRATTPLHSPAISSRGSSPGRSMNKLRKTNRDSSVSSISVLDMPESAHVKEEIHPSPTAPPTEVTSPQSARVETENRQQRKRAGQLEDAQDQRESQSRRARAGHTHIITYTRPRALSDRTNETNSAFRSPWILSKKINSK